MEREAPDGFVCPYRDRCPHLDGLSAFGLFQSHQHSIEREHEHWRIRQEMADESGELRSLIHEQAREIERLRAENRLLHQRGFKSVKRPTTAQTTAEASPSKRLGPPKGHPAWKRRTPEHIDQSIHVEAPLFCPHCQSATDPQNGGQTSYVQEDLVMIPRAVATNYVHDTAFCPKCRRQVIAPLEGELPFAPIGPKAKATALYLRHVLRLPYRKINAAMKTLFGLDFVAASTLGFEKRAARNASPIHADLLDKMRLGAVVHADETHWRENGHAAWLWYGGNESIAAFRIDAHRNSQAATALLGERLEGLLVTDAYAAYNAVEAAGGRQSCLAHLLRKAREIGEELALIPQADTASVRFCKKIKDLFQKACKVKIPVSSKERKTLSASLYAKLDCLCRKPLAFAKAETLRKRLLPDSAEYEQLFVFIKHNGPPTNNHAERALRPLVIFRKVCLGTRSHTGSDNIALFASLSQTAILQGSDILNVFLQLFRSSPNHAHDAIFGSTDPPGK
jgi:transposase